MTVRSSYLDAARENGTRQAVSRGLLLTAGGGSAGGTTTGTLVRFIDLDVGVAVTTSAERAEVVVHGETVWVPADPGAYVLGGPVVVVTDGTGRPVRVTGPAGTVPSVPEGQPSPVVVHRPELVLDQGARSQIVDAVVSIGEAQAQAVTARDLVAAIRERTGRKTWAGETFTEVLFTWSPLGGGRVRLKSLRPGNASHGWVISAIGGGDGPTLEVSVPAAGDYEVEYETDDPDYGYEVVTVTVTPEMMSDDYGWTDLTLPLDQLVGPGGPLDPDALAALWQDVVVAGFLVATEAIIGPNVIATDAVQAPHLNAVSTDAEGRGVAITGSGIVATESDGAAARFTYGGMQVINPDGEPTTQLGTFDFTGLALQKGKETTVSIDDDGHGAFVELAAEKIWYDGVELTELLGLDVEVEEESWDEPRPRGILGVRTFADDRGPWTSLTGVGYIGWVATPGRMYKITASGRVRNIATGTGVQVELRGLHSGNPAAGYPGPPSIPWPVVGLSPVVPAHKDSDSRWVGFEKSWYWTPDPQGTVLKPARMLLCLAPPEGGNVAWAAGGTLAVEDVGLVPATASGWHMGGSSGGTGGDPTPAPVDPTPTKTRKTSPFGMAWVKSWQENGDSPGAIAGRAMQGYSTHYPAGGNYRSMVGFNSMTSTLSGVPTADIEKVEVEVRNAYNWPTTFVIRPHGATSAPGSFSQETAHGSVSVQVPAASTRWVTLPSSTHGGWRDGTFRGVSFLAPNNGSQYYGYANRVRARVTYRS